MSSTDDIKFSLTLADIQAVHPTALFFVQRNIDNSLVIYIPQVSKSGKRLIQIVPYWSSQDDIKTLNEMSGAAREHVFGASITEHTVKKSSGSSSTTTLWRVRIACMPEREIIIKRKKRGPPFRAYADIGDQKDSKLELVHAELQRFPPQVKYLCLKGVSDGLSTGPTEVLVISDEVMNQFLSLFTDLL